MRVTRGKLSDPTSKMEVQRNKLKEALSMIVRATNNGKYQVGDRLRFEGEVAGINSVGNGMRVLLDFPQIPGKFQVSLPERIDAEVIDRPHKSPGQLYWESVRDEAITRTDGTAHPTQPWENLLPATKAKMEERAARFIDSVVNAG